MNTATPELIPFLLCAAAVLIIIAYKLKRNRNFLHGVIGTFSKPW